MKKSILFILLAIAFLQSTAQNSSTLEINDTRITISGEGAFFDNSELGTRAFEVPKVDNPSDPKKSTIYQAGLWIGAEDSQNNIRLSAMTYRQRGQDFYHGPISIDSAKTRLKFKKMYTVTKAEIDAHIANPATASGDILNWPGNGDTMNGEPWQLAPFVDLNGNTKYEPKLGDYPKIKGAVANYCVYNDYGFHGESGGKPLLVDVHQMFYQEELGKSGGVFDYTTLAWFKIVNRSTESYSNVKIGVWTDFDIGNFADDHVGCDTLRSLFYAYNGDENDEGSLGYGLNPPAQGVSFLNHKMSSFMYYHNNSIPINGNPSLPSAYYNYLNSRWQNGASIDSLNRPYYAFPGDPVSGSGITEAGYGNTPGDRRGLGVVGPFSLAPGESVCVEVAFIYGRSTFGGAKPSITTLRNLTEYAKIAYSNDLYGWMSFGCEAGSGVSSVVTKAKVSNLSMYPNPCYDVLHIDVPNVEGKTVFVIDRLGRTVVKDRVIGGKLPVSNLAPGLYTVKLDNYIGKLVKI